jgi:hypothetical protein
VATVFLAPDLKHDQEAARKVLHRAVAASVGAERFLSDTLNAHNVHLRTRYARYPLHRAGLRDL